MSHTIVVERRSKAGSLSVDVLYVLVGVFCLCLLFVHVYYTADFPKRWQKWLSAARECESPERVRRSRSGSGSRSGPRRSSVRATLEPSRQCLPWAFATDRDLMNLSTVFALFFGFVYSVVFLLDSPWLRQKDECRRTVLRLKLLTFCYHKLFVFLSLICRVQVSFVGGMFEYSAKVLALFHAANVSFLLVFATTVATTLSATLSHDSSSRRHRTFSRCSLKTPQSAMAALVFFDLVMNGCLTFLFVRPLSLLNRNTMKFQVQNVFKKAEYDGSKESLVRVSDMLATSRRNSLLIKRRESNSMGSRRKRASTSSLRRRSFASSKETEKSSEVRGQSAAALSPVTLKATAIRTALGGGLQPPPSIPSVAETEAETESGNSQLTDHLETATGKKSRPLTATKFVSSMKRSPVPTEKSSLKKTTAPRCIATAVSSDSFDEKKKEVDCSSGGGGVLSSAIVDKSKMSSSMLSPATASCSVLESIGASKSETQIAAYAIDGPFTRLVTRATLLSVAMTMMAVLSTALLALFNVASTVGVAIAVNCASLCLMYNFAPNEAAYNWLCTRSALVVANCLDQQMERQLAKEVAVELDAQCLAEAIGDEHIIHSIKE